MTTKRFSLDSNVLVYAADRRAGARHERALAILDRAPRRDCILTLQALAEFFHATTRKGMVPKADAAAQVRDWSVEFPVAAADVDALRAALGLAMDGRFGFWDALLLATAERHGCAVMLSEDMQDGMRLNRLIVCNPFAGDALPAPVAELL
jgi:predicted nucleic acid-binding protein